MMRRMEGSAFVARPSRGQILAAAGRTIPDVIAPDLAVLFCGINPGLYSGATGRHFARPGNRFWRTLHLAGFTDRVLAPREQEQLLADGLGITNLVERATATADELSKHELLAGARALELRVERFGPRFVAVLGVSAYRTAFGRARAEIGLQPEGIGSARVWVLPNPSGLNASYQLPALVQAFAELRAAADGWQPAEK
jgi:TDG/mug DNA glycosylase family protein